jgi:hypothetical protein
MALNISTDFTSAAFCVFALDRFEAILVVAGSSAIPMEPAERTMVSESSFAKVRFMVLTCDGIGKG